MQYKGHLIKSLKTNINDERLYRKKILNNNDNSMIQKRSESLGDHDPDNISQIHHTKNNSFTYNTTLYKQYRNNMSGSKPKNGNH
jgi:hypothetical protein